LPNPDDAPVMRTTLDVAAFDFMMDHLHFATNR
jgi:hypothetical protein